MNSQSATFKFCIRAATLLIAVFVIGQATTQSSSTVIWSKQETPSPSLSTAITFSPDGQLVSTGRTESNSVNLRSAGDGTLIRVLTGKNNNARALAFSPDSQLLVTGAGGPGVGLGLNLWRVADGERLVGRIPSHNNGTNGVSFSPDGQMVATSGFHDRDIMLWHVPDMTLVRTINNFDPDLGIALFVTAVAFSPDGQFLANGDGQGVKLRRVSDGALVRKMGGPGTDVVSLAFAPDGSKIVAGITGLDPTYGTCVDCSVKLWSVPDGALLRRFLSRAGELRYPKVGFSADGLSIAAGFGINDETGAIQFWSIRTGASVFIDSQPSPVHAFAYSPDGRRYGYVLANGLVAVAQSPPGRL
jgi:WD domain, G-beta repeat/WD40-like Beta Propeller Repeat